MRIQLPIETWIEILDWLKRRDLLKKLDKLWDREFTPIAQDWLHKYTRNVKIGRLIMTNDDALGVHVGNNWQIVPYAQVEMPGNITCFERITIKYLDSKILAFLHRMRPLFHNVHLRMDYGYEDDSYRIILRSLMSMFSSASIGSMSLGCDFLQLFSTNYPSALLNVKLLDIWGIFKLDATELLMNWLFTPRKDGQPRTVVLSDLLKDFAGFWEKIQERFLAPARQIASPFFILICYYLPNASSAIENARTGEQLTVNGKSTIKASPSVMISNCPVNIDQEWLAKKKEEMSEWDTIIDQQQAIWLDSSKLGPLDPTGEDEPQQKQSSSGSSIGENPQEKPGTSKAQNLEEEEEPGKKRARLI